METAEFVETLTVEHHKHSRREGLIEAGEILEEVTAPVEDFVGKAALAKDIRRRQVEVFLLHSFETLADERGVRKFDVGIQKQHVRRGGQRSAVVATNSRQAAGDYLDRKAIAEATNNVGRSIR